MGADEAVRRAQDEDDEARIAQIEERLLQQPYDPGDYAPIADAAEYANLRLPADPATLAASVAEATETTGATGATETTDTAGERESVYSEDGLSWPKVTAGEAKRLGALMGGLSQRLGVSIEFFDGDADDARQGAYDPDRRAIWISNKASGFDAVVGILAHEITHPLQGTAEYLELREFLFEREYKGASADISRALDDLKARYKSEAGIELSDSGAREELTADLMRKMIGESSGAMLFNLAKEKPTIAQRLMNMLRSAVETIRRLAASPDQLREYRVMRKAEALLGEAMDAAAAGRGETGGGVQLSVQQTDNGIPYTRLDTDQDLFIGKSASEVKDIAGQIIKSRFQGRVIGDAPQNAFVNRNTIDELRHPANYRNLSIR
jgi:hypothetical protein